MTLDAAISTLSAQANLDGRGSEILAAAITLRDSQGCGSYLFLKISTLQIEHVFDTSFEI